MYKPITYALKFFKNDSDKQLASQAITRLSTLLNAKPNFTVVNYTADADSCDAGDEDLMAFADLLETVINGSDVAKNAIYYYLEALTHQGMDITIDGRSLRNNIAEVGEDGLQYIFSYAQLIKEEDLT